MVKVSSEVGRGEGVYIGLGLWAMEGGNVEFPLGGDSRKGATSSRRRVGSGR